jgi:hypothetical protein
MRNIVLMTEEAMEDAPSWLKMWNNYMVVTVNKSMATARCLFSNKARKRLDKFRTNNAYPGNRSSVLRRRELNRSFAARVLREWRREAKV